MGYQLVDTLNFLGLEALVATPNGDTANWFSTKAKVVDRDEVIRNWKSSDIAIFSLPYDYRELRNICDRLVFHCQGTDPAIDAFLTDETMAKIACWSQAEDYFRKFGAASVIIPLALPEVFFYSGERKVAKRVSYMPRRGGEFFNEATAQVKGWQYQPIDGQHEDEVARCLKGSSHFLSTSEGEWFGLPALEAMAAGCVVLSPQVVGGTEYLKHLETAIIGDANQLREYLSGAGITMEQEIELAQRGMAMAHQYSLVRQRRAAQLAIESGVFS